MVVAITLSENVFYLYVRNLGVIWWSLTLHETAKLRLNKSEHTSLERYRSIDRLQNYIYNALNLPDNDVCITL